jgi:hypothetical protein
MCMIMTIYTHSNNVNSDEASVNINPDGCTTHFCTGRQIAGACEKPVCARHGTELVGCKSPRQVFVEPKARRRARAQSRGWVWRKSNPKARGDEQEPDMRCGTLGTSGHVTIKSSIYDWGVLYKSGVYAQ